MTRLIRPEPEPDEQEHEPVEEEVDEEAARRKVFDKIEAAQENELLDKLALCFALVEYVGEAGPNGAHNGSGDKFEELAEWLSYH
jgi:hypothetical protein